MCRNIKTLHNFDPPATDDEVRASAIQFVRKLSGFNKPSKQNEAAFEHAVDQVTRAARELLGNAGDDGAAARPRRRGREGEGAGGGAVRAAGAGDRRLRGARGAFAQPKNRYVTAIAASTPTSSENSAQPSAWRVFFTPTEPKYTAST
jgi:hypothetical protein